jgi:hypothetical protein
MSRLLCLIMLSLGLVQIAAADETDPDHERISAYLTQKFGVARAKAEQISDAVQTAAAKNPASRKRPRARAGRRA